MYKELLKKIKDAEYISIFRHVRPDGDAIYSAFALKQYILHNFNEKKVKVAGDESFDIHPVTEKLSDAFIKKSLAIIVDCSTEERTDDKRFKTASDCIIIDHHPIKQEPGYASLIIRDTKVSATCELLAKIFYSRTFSDYEMDKTCMEYLYCGILTDSNSFRTASTTSRTLYYASKLVKDGDLLVSDLEDKVFAQNLSYFEEVTKIRNYLRVKRGVGYIILSKQDLEKIGTTFTRAKNCIDEFADIKDLKVWCIFAYNDEYEAYDGSIRSRREYAINELAYKYNGGGHRNACGVKRLSLKKVHDLIDELIDKCQC